MRALALVASSLLASTLAAQASWSTLYPTVTPPPRAEATLGMHERLGKAILLWGAENGFPATTAWVLAGTTWTLQSGALPPFRYGAALAFDAARDELVAFGGNGAILFDDTWRWDGTQWTQLQVATRPPSRSYAAMAYDRARGVVVLFGGNGGSSAPYLADTWEWNGVAWQQRLPSASPPARNTASMAFDPVGGGVLMYGGLGPGLGGGTMYIDTWTWDGVAWTQRQPASPPPPRIAPGMTTDLCRQRVVLLGGQGGDPFTWEWDGSEWNARYQPSPGARYLPGIGYDAALRRVVLHGGMATINSTNYFMSDTWKYSTPLPADVVAFGAGCAGSTGTPELAAAPFSLPWLGDTMRNVVDHVPQGELGAVFVSSFSTTLPAPLGALGMPGCDLLVGLDSLEFRAAVAGRAEWAVALPNAPSLAGVVLRQQAFVFDAAANAFGLAASNGVVVTVGVR